MGFRRGVDNQMSGSATNVVQAGSVGELHIHEVRGFRPRTPAGLPATVAKLVNQVEVLKALDEVLAGISEEPAIAVLLGARGSGKSTVGLYWLHGLSERFPDGQLYANLGAGTDHTTAPFRILFGFLVSLGVDAAQIPGDIEGRAHLFRTVTRGLSLQVLLDDAVAAAQVKHLLPGPGKSVVIVTGHGGLIALAEQNARFIDVEPLNAKMSAELLRGFARDRVDAEPAARDALVALCSGRAIALSVVGRLLAESPKLSLSELLEELTDPELGITGVTVDGEPAISTVLDAGYRRLSERARRAYRVLGQHPSAENGISVQALAAACGVPEVRLKPVVRELIKGTRMVDEISGRLVLDALVTDHSRKVADAGDPPLDREAAQRAFVRWYATGAVATYGKLQRHRPWRRVLFPETVIDTTHPAHSASERFMHAERANLITAAGLAFELGDFDAVVHICVAQWWLYEAHRLSDDLLATHDLGVQAAGQLGKPLVKALLLVQNGFAVQAGARYDDAASLFTEAQELASSHNAVDLAATAIEGAALALLAAGEHTRARPLLRHNLALADQIGDDRRTAIACLHAAKAEDAVRALELLAHAWTLLRSLEVPDRANLAKVLLWQGRVLAGTGDLVAGRDHLNRALASAAEVGRDFDRAQVLDALGDLEANHDRPRAAQHYERALEIYLAGGHLRAASATQARMAAIREES
ncbi:hypothetical protein GCM10011609_85660 [Lentzea pudingi]|uniref:NB-ARC domain-containing protein n=1 Tax=Lentzea pudingi TaxID=1789439 RepID=A0ABQ2IVP0_9PSEU|nr:tetratricopeptide repeat protein [Lentzea pudingi]GGN28984.1 hypothetical protein GCM10011609_85660 [Lentzea pudingi]